MNNRDLIIIHRQNYTMRHTNPSIERQEWPFKTDIHKWYVRRLGSGPYYHAFPVYKGVWKTMHPVWLPVFIICCN